MTSTAEVLDRLISLVRDNYVFPDVAAEIVEGLDGLVVDGPPDEVAAACTTRLQAVNKDRHLRVRRRRAMQADGETGWAAHYAADALRNAGGVRVVSRPDAQTGLLEIAPYMSPVHLAEPYLKAAFALLTGVDHLVIDLRAALGGTPETVAFICGYLLGDEPVHLQDMVDRDGNTRQYWTSPAAVKFPSAMPIAVLTSERTFSGGEELAYNLQALERATIFGRRTGGGAHPVEVFGVTDALEVAVPVARSVNAVTCTNWEQTGVVPDVECEPNDAIEQARQWFDEPPHPA
jgi:Peptidase family S41